MADLTKGFEELRQELSEIAKAIDGPERKQALEDGGEIVEDRARSLAPERTGLIKREGIVRGNNTGEYIEVGWSKDGFYDKFLEWGTSKMAPRAHIRPAWEQTQSKVLETMLSKMKLK